jgi:hypothetical protein
MRIPQDKALPASFGPSHAEPAGHK